MTAGMKMQDGLHKLPALCLCPRLVFPNAGGLPAKQNPSPPSTLTAKHQAQLQSTPTAENVEVSILEPKGTAPTGPWMLVGSSSFSLRWHPLTQNSTETPKAEDIYSYLTIIPR